jgi:hypothetical protein
MLSRPRDRQKRLAAKEVLREIDLAPRRARQVREIQCRHPEPRNNGPARFNETGKTNWDYSGI